MEPDMEKAKRMAKVGHPPQVICDYTGVSKEVATYLVREVENEQTRVRG